MTIVDETKPTNVVDPAFVGQQPGGYWTSTPVAGTGDFWVVHFQFGETVPSGMIGGQRYVRCVR